MILDTELLNRMIHMITNGGPAEQETSSVGTETVGVAIRVGIEASSHSSLEFLQLFGFDRDL